MLEPIRVAKRNWHLNKASNHLPRKKVIETFLTLSFILRMVPPQSLPSTPTQPTTARSTQRCTTFTLWTCDVIKGKEAKPNNTTGEIIASKYFSRNFSETWRLVRTCLFLWNFAQAICKQCASSVSDFFSNCQRSTCPSTYVLLCLAKLLLKHRLPLRSRVG